MGRWLQQLAVYWNVALYPKILPAFPPWGIIRL